MTVGLAAGFAFLQWSCQPEEGEAYSTRKLTENKADIEAYLQRQGLTAQRTENDLYYVVSTTNPNGQKPQTGDEIRFHFVKYRLDGIVVDSTTTASPARLIYDAYGYTLAPGIIEGVQLLKEGETATLFLPYNLQNTNQGTLLLPAFSPARYVVRVTSVRTETEQITDYLTANKLTDKFETTSSGLRFYRTATYADSAQVKTGQTVTMKYTGKLLDGTQFDSSTNFNFKPGEGQVVKGYEEAALKMRVGEKATVIMPSAVAYGVQGSFNQNTRQYTIPPYTPLVFDIEIVSSK